MRHQPCYGLILREALRSIEITGFFRYYHYRMSDDSSYLKIVNSLKRRKKRATVADVCADTALPLSTVRELLPKAADEYSGHLQVTQSGEILYNFSNGFTSRYRGLGVFIRKAARKITDTVKTAFVFLFKVWTMVMLIGYFLLFLAIALASVFISVAAQSKSSNNSRRAFYGPNLFSLFWRIWFYSELTKPRYRYGNVTQKKEEKRAMHKSIFSFIFGEDDPNSGWEEKINKAIITYIQSNKGTISLVEYMVFTGENSAEAEKSILSFCSRYGGSPEVTEEGYIVYRFDDLLLRADLKTFSELTPPVMRLKTFSANSKNMNTWFVIINAVNLIFGSYFLYNAVVTGRLITEIQYQSASYLYAFTHYAFWLFTSDPASLIFIFLGIVPFIFSLFFWLIPSCRYFTEKKENNNIKLSNFKRIAFGKIWSSPENIDINQLSTDINECRPENIAEAGDRVIKELGAISDVEIEQTENGKTVYSFKELKDEKHSVEKYRSNIDPSSSQLGKTIFNSAD